MTTTELAQRLYEKWRQGQDFYNPLEAPIGWDNGWDGKFKQTGTAIKQRPKWALLDTVQQNVWRAVAFEAAQHIAGFPETSVTKVRSH